MGGAGEYSLWRLLDFPGLVPPSPKSLGLWISVEPGILGPGILGQGAALKPLAVQPPLAARPPADCRRPARTGPDPSASPCGSTPAASTRTDPAIQLQLAPQQQRQPARAPLPRPAQPQFRQIDADEMPSRPSQRSSGNSDSLRGCTAPSSKPQSTAATPILSIVDLAQIQYVPLRYAPAALPTTSPSERSFIDPSHLVPIERKACRKPSR
jgi:hypothetical protein